MSNFIAMCIGGGIGCFVAAPVGFLVGGWCRVAKESDQRAELAHSKRDDVDELAQMFEKGIKKDPSAR